MDEQTTRIQAGTMTFRVENEWWKCYWCPDDKKNENAILLGSIAATLIDGKPKLQWRFIELMQELFRDVADDALGGSTTFTDAKYTDADG